MNKLFGFLFGKSPEIFDQDGNVRHNFPKEKWTAWENRFRAREYDWHQHRGTERGAKKNANTSKTGPS